MAQFDFKKIISHLGNVLRCPVCSDKYHLEHIRLIESMHDEASSETHLLVHSDCHKCKSSVMFNIDIAGPQVFSVGVLTDLTSVDSTKFSKLEPISANEIISLHQNLKSFNGDLVKVLGVK